MRALICGGLFLIGPAFRVAAQEPRPVRLSAAALADSVNLELAWRYAPGDGMGRESRDCDDSRWQPVVPALASTDDSGKRWSGIGWFRRHLVIDPAVQSQTLVLRIAAPGAASVFLDGSLILATGREPAAAMPAERSDAVLVRFRGGAKHVLAVRYVFPPAAPRPPEGFGFRLSLGRWPPAAPSTPRMWAVGVEGAMIALPVFLAFLHFALFGFDTRARENLFYALQMLTFAGVVLQGYSSVLVPSAAAREVVDKVGGGLPPLAILFGILTYYALRTRPFPRRWRVFAAAALLLFAGSVMNHNVSQYGWMALFVAMIVEVVRIERSGRVIQREGIGFFLVSFAVFGFTVVLQILVNFGVFQSIVGLQQVYIVGILASAVGMSLFLARTLGRSRLNEVENDRKTRELARARELQLSMLPREMPRVRGMEIAAGTQTAAEVGGDYYDVRASDGEALFAFGDATGHGLSAGIVVTAAKALFTALTTTEPLTDLLGNCDRAFAGMELPSLRMCLALARITPQRIDVASAAMPPLMIHRATTGQVEELGAGGLPLGTRIRQSYEERSTPLSAGDTVLFASDGFAELLDPAGRPFGYDRAAAAFREAASAQTAREVTDSLFGAAAAFRAARAQDDDITFVVVRVTTP